MQSTRRDFTKGILTASALSGLFSLPIGAEAAALVAHAQAQQSSPASDDEFDPHARSFWMNFADSLSGSSPQGQTASQESQRSFEGLGRVPFLLHYGPKGFRAPTDIPSAELVPKGDVKVSLNVETFRPAGEDRKTFEHLQSAQLRIDISQTRSLMSLLDLLAWTATAALFPDRSGKLPPATGLGFDPKTWQKMQNVVLPGGMGRWAFNLAVVKKESLLMRVLQGLGQEVGRYARVFGLPAISLTALTSFTQLYASFQPQTEWLFQQSPIPVFATASALAAAGQGTQGLPLPSGNYALVPQKQVPDVAPHLAGLELQQGYIVPKNTKAVNLLDAALETLPDVTYATINVGVRPAQLSCSGGAKQKKASA